MLLVASLVVFVMATIGGFDGWDWVAEHEFGWMNLGLALFAASFVRWDTRPG